MKRHFSARFVWAAGGLWLLLVADLQAGSGSWVGDAASVRLFTPGRSVESAPIVPPARLPYEARIRQVTWRFEPPIDQPYLEAWLCQQRCIFLPAARGSSQALAGLDASRPLFFLFRPPEGRRVLKPFRVRGLQVIVDYQSAP